MAATPKVMDMTNVKERGDHNPKHKPEGDYKAKIVKVVDYAKAGTKVPNQWLFTIVLESDKRATYPHYVSWDTEQAWKSRNLCVAAGLAVPKKKIKIDPNKLVGKFIGITLEDDEYEGRKKSTIGGVFPVTELTADEPDADDDDDTSGDDDIEDLDLEEV